MLNLMDRRKFEEDFPPVVDKDSDSNGSVTKPGTSLKYLRFAPYTLRFTDSLSSPTWWNFENASNQKTLRDRRPWEGFTGEILLRRAGQPFSLNDFRDNSDGYLAEKDVMTTVFD